MNLILDRHDPRKDGIFSDMHDESGNFHVFSLEHAYPLSEGADGDPNGIQYRSKIPAGVYTCKRGTGPGIGEFQGMHRLHDGVWFDAFEIMDVPGHAGCLIHVANYNDDLEGCVGVGLGLGRTSAGGQMLTSSKQAFNKFMEFQYGIAEFQLKINDAYIQNNE